MTVDLSKLSATPTKVEDIVLYLQQAIPSLISAIGEIDDTFSEENVAPSKPREGMIRYADGTNWNPGSGAGLYRYTGGAWVLIMGSGGAGVYAPLNSPTLTGDPKAPTPAAGDTDTSIATTAFLKIPGPIGSTTPNTIKGTTVEATTSLTTPIDTFLGCNAVFHLREEQASGTNAGTFTSGAWQTRVLNTTKTNTISGASLASNQITLPAGTYWFEAFAPAFDVNAHKAKLYNVTDASDILIGESSHSAPANNATTVCAVRGRFTLAGSKALEVRHQCQTTKATTGFGVAFGFSVVEVFTEVAIWKIA